MWKLYNWSQAFGQRPSAAIGIKNNPWLAWQFDNAVFTLGRWVENKYNERDPKTHKRKHRLETLLGIKPRLRKVNVAALAASGERIEFVRAPGTAEPEA